MGIGGISIWQLLIILAIVVLLFGTKKLKGMGSDLGGAVKGFKDAFNKDDGEKDNAALEKDASLDMQKEEASSTSEKK